MKNTNTITESEESFEILYPHFLTYIRHYLISSIIILSSLLILFLYKEKMILILLFIGIIYFLITESIRKSNQFIITNKQIIHKFKFIKNKRSGAIYDRIQYMHLEQNLFERIFNIGNIHISTSGTKELEILFFGIKNPEKIKKIIQKKMITFLNDNPNYLFRK